jgi:hypothetical protein
MQKFAWLLCNPSALGLDPVKNLGFAAIGRRGTAFASRSRLA